MDWIEGNRESPSDRTLDHDDHWRIIPYTDIQDDENQAGATQEDTPTDLTTRRVDTYIYIDRRKPVSKRDRRLICQPARQKQLVAQPSEGKAGSCLASNERSCARP